MGVKVQGKKLLIDDEAVATNLQAFESVLVYESNDHTFGFINLKDAAGQIVKVAVVSDEKIKQGKFARSALALKIIIDEVQTLMEEEFHLKDRYRTDKNTLKLIGDFEKLATQGCECDSLKQHVEMISKLEGELETAIETLKGKLVRITEDKAFGDEELSDLLETYIHSYVFPLEYELQAKGYLLNGDYINLKHDIDSKKFKLGLFERKRVKKYVDMMAGLEMKHTPWISILEENLKKPLSANTSDEKMKSALKSHLHKQAKLKADSIIYK